MTIGAQTHRNVTKPVKNMTSRISYGTTPVCCSAMRLYAVLTAICPILSNFVSREIKAVYNLACRQILCRLSEQMRNEQIRKLLEQKGVRRTKIREAMLALFFDKDYALSHADVESLLPEEFDRVTIYRTLKSFEEQGLVHKVPDEKGIMRYALCAETCNRQQHTDSHLHFFCRRCQRTYCLHIPSTPLPTLPVGFQAESFEWLAQGICKECLNK